MPEGTKVVQQISFKVGSPQDIREYHERLQAENMRIDRFVSHGNAIGMYFLDTEDNRIEVYYKPVSRYRSHMATCSAWTTRTRTGWPRPARRFRLAAGKQPGPRGRSPRRRSGRPHP